MLEADTLSWPKNGGVPQTRAGRGAETKFFFYSVQQRTWHLCPWGWTRFPRTGGSIRPGVYEGKGARIAGHELSQRSRRCALPGRGVNHGLNQNLRDSARRF